MSQLRRAVLFVIVFLPLLLVFLCWYGLDQTTTTVLWSDVPGNGPREYHKRQQETFFKISEPDMTDTLSLVRTASKSNSTDINKRSTTVGHHHHRIIKPISKLHMPKQKVVGGRSISNHPLPRSRLRRVWNNIDSCLEITHMRQSTDDRVALENAKLFLQEYSKIIPQEFLSNYSSHCWKMRYDVSILHSVMYQSHIGNLPFKGGLVLGPPTLNNPLTVLKETFRGNFSSNTICLPSVFLIGFPKCGSTYLWCIMQSLVRLSTNLSIHSHIEIDKEPHYWAKIRVTRSVKMPKAADLAEYLLNFLPGLQKVDKHYKKDVLFMDGTPNMLFDWPRFTNSQPNTSNYCLLPSILPELLPKSKFVVVMRNPMKMLYSAFWFSCTTKGIKVPYETQLKGPSLFHDRVTAKIDMFNDCMRDTDSMQFKTACSVQDDAEYGNCITQRLHMLDRCVHKINFNLFTKELPNCGRSRVEMGLFYTHVRKWLSVVPKEKMLFLTLEEIVKSPVRVASRLLTFLDLKDVNVEEHMDRITWSCLENSQDTINYKHDPKLRMRNDTEMLLYKFFQPFNSILAELLDDSRFLWNDS